MSDQAIRLTRTIPAPPDDVYRAFLEPELLRQWFCPRDFEVVDVEIDARVGGRHHTTIVAPDGGRHAFACEIRELVPGARIVLIWTFEPSDYPGESVLTVTLREAGPGTTELTLVHDRLAARPPDELDQVRGGWDEALDKLVSLYPIEGANR
jgi:uncharacterized protein YndB with AHSA1/START domain